MSRETSSTARTSPLLFPLRRLPNADSERSKILFRLRTSTRLTEERVTAAMPAVRRFFSPSFLVPVSALVALVARYQSRPRNLHHDGSHEGDEEACHLRMFRPDLLRYAEFSYPEAGNRRNY